MASWRWCSPGRATNTLARLALLGVAVVLSAAVLAACGNSSSGHPKYSVSVGSVAGLGHVLVDGDGHTLYMYAPDHHGRPTCYAMCAAQWPPLLLPHGVQHPIAGAGIDAALLGTVARKGGTTQVTYDGWPLYLYAVDIRPGQASGQGIDMGLWYVLSPNGSVDRRTPTT